MALPLPATADLEFGGPKKEEPAAKPDMAEKEYVHDRAPHFE